MPDSMAALGGDLNSEISIGSQVDSHAHSRSLLRLATLPRSLNCNSPTDLAQREDGLYQFAFIMSIKELLC